MEVTPASPRLRFSRLTRDGLGLFHRLVVDPHVRAYMMDGQVMDPAWSRACLEASDRLFAGAAVGLWLVQRRDAADPAPIGFCGFHVFAEPGPEPQLIYALREEHTGQGLATEIAAALLEVARGRGWARVVAAVDEPNAASIAVLRKHGFRQTLTFPGAFGRCLFFVRPFARPLPQAPLARGLLEATASPAAGQELIEALVTRGATRIERIVSHGETTPPGTWYDQDENEWVLVLEGAARLGYADGSCAALAPGDSLLLPARCRHRVEWTRGDGPTVRIAVFF